MSDFGLAGRAVIVTGAGKGLGRAYAVELARRGAAVVVNNRRHPGESDEGTSAMQVVAEIRAAGGRAEANWDDVCDPASGTRMVAQALDAFGRLDAVVANAAVGTVTPFAKTSIEDFRAVFDPGFFGNLYLAHAAWPHLRGRRHGRIVLTASSAGLYGVHGMAAYSASKAAVIGLMRALSIEGRSADVLVNVIAPYGYSQMTSPWMSEEQARLFAPSEVAPLVAWLASPACGVSGEIFLSGAGSVRRAAALESDSAVLDPANPAATIAALYATPSHGFGDANASFADFMARLNSRA